MKIYRTSIRRPDNEHVGYLFRSSQAEAAQDRKAAKADGNLAETEVFDITPNSRGQLIKSDWFSLLNRFGGHADNG